MAKIILTPQQLQAATNLRGIPDFMEFLGGVADHCANQNEALIKQPEGDEYLRGQVFALSDLLEAVNNAPEKLTRAKQPKT